MWEDSTQNSTKKTILLNMEIKKIFHSKWYQNNYFPENGIKKLFH